MTNKDKIVYLIVGRSCTGKNQLAHELQKLKWKRLISYTTRPKRVNESDDTYNFITKEEADQIPAEGKIAKVTINDNDYFATINQIYESDYFIVDPVGAKYLIDNISDITFALIHLAADDNIREIRYINREKDSLDIQKDPKALLTLQDKFKKRNEVEDISFKDLETFIQECDTLSLNEHINSDSSLGCIIQLNNNEDNEDNILRHANYLKQYNDEIVALTKLIHQTKQKTNLFNKAGLNSRSSILALSLTNNSDMLLDFFMHVLLKINTDSIKFNEDEQNN